MKYIQNTQGKLKYLSESRRDRAKALLQTATPRILDEFTYAVPSQTHPGRSYQVTHLDSFSCECPDFQHRCKGRNLYCKHIQAICLLEKLKTAVEVNRDNLLPQIEFEPIPQQETICPHCLCTEIFKRGKRRTEAGEKQLYCCKECKKRFVLEPIKHIKTSAEMVMLALDQFYKGNSLRDIADTFMQFYGISLHHETIRRWILKFSKLMNEHSKTLQPKTSGIWNADETLTRTKKSKMDYEYVWNIRDRGTQFLLASRTSGHGRSAKDAQKVITEAYKQSKAIPYQIISDKLASYQGGILKTFRNWGKERKVKHTSILGRRREVNNNAVENLNGLQKEFHKVRRGVNHVQDYADGLRVFHNHIRNGVKDKRTPAQRAGVGTNTQNRWMGLLAQSMKALNATISAKEVKSHGD